MVSSIVRRQQSAADTALHQQHSEVGRRPTARDLVVVIAGHFPRSQIQLRWNWQEIGKPTGSMVSRIAGPTAVGKSDVAAALMDSFRDQGEKDRVAASMAAWCLDGQDEEKQC